jgi:hypothetical protein
VICAAVNPASESPFEMVDCIAFNPDTVLLVFFSAVTLDPLVEFGENTLTPVTPDPATLTLSEPCCRD